MINESTFKLDSNVKEIEKLAKLCIDNSKIDATLYAKYDVKRGLRDISGKGVLTGLTEISEIICSKTVNGESVPGEGELYYRGYNIEDIIAGSSDRKFAFEETVYLLLFGKLPSEKELEEFKKIMVSSRMLPSSFVRDIIMKAPSKDMMNSLARSVLTLYAYDDKAEDTSIENVLRQSLQLISVFPMISVYGYQAYKYYHGGDSLFIHAPRDGYSIAENILHMLRSDSKFTELEARVLDMSLVLHAEHGGGNNSSFTTHVVTSSGTDTYSTIAAALGSLKGPKHGGANIKVIQMFEDLKQNVKDWNDDDEIVKYLMALLNKEKFDKKGLIYGIGHAIYSMSDPRATMFRSFVESLSEEKGLQN
ncbi:MAG: citrate synthase, partial [Oscillospiraceae bacterium]|nr:citrate synthase [Oscillospiraceae bacterium]